MAPSVSVTKLGEEEKEGELLSVVIIFDFKLSFTLVPFSFLS